MIYVFVCMCVYLYILIIKLDVNFFSFNSVLYKYELNNCKICICFRLILLKMFIRKYRNMILDDIVKKDFLLLFFKYMCYLIYLFVF